jgi:recombination protein RecA
MDAITTKFGKGAIGPVISEGLSIPCTKSRHQNIDDLLTGATTRNRNGKPITKEGSGRGWPRGRIIEVAGKESGGKTTFCLDTVAAFQEAGCVCAYLDAEHALDLEYAERLGVDLDELMLSQPDSAEQTLDIVTMLVRSCAVDLIVVDSVAALAPLDEQEKDSGDVTVALLPRLLSTELRKLTALLGRKKSQATVIFINQEREIIGVYGNGPKTKTPGGKALKFYASIRIDIRNVGQIKQGSTVIGQRSRVKVVKNKVATPFREMFIDMVGGEGIVETHTQMKR